MKKDNLNNKNKDELIEIIKKIRKEKRYGLVWEDIPEEKVDNLKKNHSVLINNKKFNLINNSDINHNVLIESDNLDALHTLSSTFTEKIDVIYIDPPYNTGARDWKYNNNFVDSEDAFRHSKWLNMMESRLKISKKLLNDDGIICVTIDDYELPRLFMLLEEIFGRNNFLGNAVIRNNPGGRKSKRKIAAQHEYALFFSKSPQTNIAKLDLNVEDKSHKYTKNDKGEWVEPRNLRKEGSDSLAKPNSPRFYPIYFDPETGQISSKHKLAIEILPIDTNGKKRIWRRSKDVIDELYQKNELSIKKTKYGNQVYFEFKGGLKGETPKSLLLDPKYSASEHGTTELDNILGERETFNFPKSKYATAECIRIASSKKDAIILDFFAGSGTTGQSVLELNKEDGGNRKFILVTNNENNIAKDVTYPRLKKVINGYSNIKREKIKGLGGNLLYYTIDFVSADRTDPSLYELATNLVDTICLKENTFEKIKKTQDVHIYNNKEDHYSVIVFNEDKLNTALKELEKTDGSYTFYIFSLGGNTFDDELEEFKKEHPKTVSVPFPQEIKKLYSSLNSLLTS